MEGARLLCDVGVSPSFPHLLYSMSDGYELKPYTVLVTRLQKTHLDPFSRKSNSKMGRTYEDLKLVKKVSEYVEAYDFEVYDVLKVNKLIIQLRPFMFATIGLYVLAVYCGQKWMKNRPPYKLKTALFMWNLGLCIFSIIATVRGAPELLYLLSKQNGIYHAGCNGTTHNYATSLWGLMILFSKFFELGDTAFIVLRKQKLIILHWYHHAATILMCWYGWEYYDSIGRYIFVNTFVHSFMYAYYAVRALKVQVPKKVSMALTTLQILQLIFGSYANYVSMSAMGQGLPCNRDWNFLYLAGAIVFSFVILFVNFYFNTYFRRKKGKLE